MKQTVMVEVHYSSPKSNSHDLVRVYFYWGGTLWHAPTMLLFNSSPNFPFDVAAATPGCLLCSHSLVVVYTIRGAAIVMHNKACKGSERRSGHGLWTATSECIWLSKINNSDLCLSLEDSKGKNFTYGHFWGTNSRSFNREGEVVRSKRGF